MTITAQNLIAILTVGLLTGVVAAQFNKDRGFDFAGDVAIGIAGGFVGYAVFGLFGVNAADGLLADVINTAFGALLFTTILVAIKNSRTRSRAVTDAVQEIHRLTITPEPGAMTVACTTKLPSVPRLELYRNITNVESEDMVPQNIVANWWLSSLPARSHSRRVDGLFHGTLFWFRLTADVEGVVGLDGTKSAASFVGKAGTLSRFCQISLPKLRLLEVNDPSGDGVEMDFALQVYDGDNANTSVAGVPHPGDPLLSPQVDWEFDNVGAGAEFGALGANVNGDGIPILNAPGAIVPYLLGVNQISGLFGTATPRTLPAATSHGGNDDGQWGDDFSNLPLPSAMGQTNTTVGLRSVHDTLAWTAEVRVDTTVSDPIGALTLVQPVPFP